MPDSGNRVPRPSTSGKRRELSAGGAFQKSALDIIYPEGELIQIDPASRGCFILRQGSLATEMVIPAPDGLKKIELDTVEAGEYFNAHALFGFQIEGGGSLRYRAQCQVVVMPFTMDMLPNNPEQLKIILASFMRSSARSEGKLRQLAAYSIQRAEEILSEKSIPRSHILDRYRSEIIERGKRLTEAIAELSKEKARNQNIGNLAERMAELETANAVLQRDNQSLTERLATAQQELDQEQRIRRALERRVAELMKQLAGEPPPSSSQKFPSADMFLASGELQELEANAKRFRAAPVDSELRSYLESDFPQSEPAADRATQPYIPDINHPAPQNEAHFPTEPPTPRLSEPSRMKTLVDGARNAGRIGNKTLTDESDRFPWREADSDITPVVPEFPAKNPPSLRRNLSGQTRAWGIDGEAAITRRDGSYSLDQIPQFRDEGSDVHQIVEEWTNVKNCERSAFGSNDRDIPDDIPPPPAFLFESISTDTDDQVAALDDIDWINGPENNTTQSYVSPGTLIDNSSPDIRTTKAYEFKAPGKPPKPKP